jgi:Flp pilus assembly protein TadD
MQLTQQSRTKETTKNPIPIPKESGFGPIPTRIKTTSPLILGETTTTPNEEVVRRLADLGVHLATIHRISAEAYLSQAMYAESMIHLDAACRFDPTNTEYHNQLGIVRFLTGDDQGALAAFSSALEIDEDNPDANFNQGMVLYGLSRRDDAERAFTRSALANDKNAETWNNLGVVRFELGRPEEARACFQKALSVEANNADAIANLKLVG